MLYRSYLRSVSIASVAVIGVVASLSARPVTTSTAGGVSAHNATVYAANTGTSADSATSAPEDRWLVGLNGKHRQLFDSPAPGGGVPLVHIMNFLDTYNSAYNVPDKEINAVGTFYGSATFHGLNDAMWTKYRLAEFLKSIGVDAGTGATPNPWRTEPQVLGMKLAQAGIESLQKRGTRFILCNNALSIFSGMVASSQGLDAKAVYADMRANLLPGVEAVPAMVVAIEQAHRANLAYHRQ